MTSRFKMQEFAATIKSDETEAHYCDIHAWNILSIRSSPMQTALHTIKMFDDYRCLRNSDDQIDRETFLS